MLKDIRGAATKKCDAQPYRSLRVDMRAVQGAVSTLQGAYLAYVTKERGAATKKCDAKIPLNMKIESGCTPLSITKSIIKYPYYNIVITNTQAFFTDFRKFLQLKGTSYAYKLRIFTIYLSPSQAR